MKDTIRTEWWKGLLNSIFIDFFCNWHSILVCLQASEGENGESMYTASWGWNLIKKNSPEWASFHPLLFLFVSSLYSLPSLCLFPSFLPPSPPFSPSFPGFFLAFLFSIFINALFGNKKLGFTLASIWLWFAQLCYLFAQCVNHFPCHVDQPVSPFTTLCHWLLGLLACSSLWVYHFSQDPQLCATLYPHTVPHYPWPWPVGPHCY